MSTRCIIKISDKWDTFYIDRTHDAFPDIIIPDIESVINFCKNSWSGAEIGLLVSVFLGFHFDKNARIQNYSVSSGPAGDESYSYYVEWCEAEGKYLYGETR